ncbi:hypothetical protein [Caproiciproducens sp.]
MKKRMVFWIGMAILTALAGCGTEIRAASAAQSAPESVSSGEASVRTVSAEYKKGDTEITAGYPQFDGKEYAGVNAQLKKEALSTMDNVKAHEDAAGIMAETAGRVEFSSKDFVSAAFETSFLKKGNPHTFRSVRTVNYDLKADQAVMEQDLIVNNDALYKAADEAVKKQLSHELQTYFTPQVLKDSLDQSQLCFKKDGIVVNFTVSTPDDHAEILIPYAETLGFRTDSSVWSNFAA